MHSNQFENQERDDQDKLLREAMHQVRIPSGLEARLKAAVQREVRLQMRVNRALATESCAEEVVGELANIAQVQVADLSKIAQRRFNRRRFMGLAVAASVCGIGAGYYYLASQPLGRASVASYCLNRLDEIEQRQHLWVHLEDAQRLKFAERFRHLASRRLSEVCYLPRDEYVRSSQAYRFDAVNGIGLILFDLTMTRNISDLNASFTPLPTRSGGWSLVGMQDRRRVFVLAGVCNEFTLLDLVGASPAV